MCPDGDAFICFINNFAVCLCIDFGFCFSEMYGCEGQIQLSSIVLMAKSNLIFFFSFFKQNKDDNNNIIQRYFNQICITCCT